MKKAACFVITVVLVFSAAGCNKGVNLETAAEINTDGGVITDLFSESEVVLPSEDTVAKETSISETQVAPNQTGTSPTVPTTKAKPKTTAASADPQARIASLLNSAPLNPMKTNFAELDNIIDNVFDKIITPGMDTYAKVKACYNYLIDNAYYQAGIYNQYILGNLTYDSDYDKDLVVFGHSVFVYGYGVCSNYSAAFAVMCRRIGLDAYTQNGKLTNLAGESKGHAWVFIKLNGEKYIFDPQVQDKMSKLPYHYFCKTNDQLKNVYHLDSSNPEKEFKSFKCRTVPDYDISAEFHFQGENRYVKSRCSQNTQSVRCDVSNSFDDGLMAYSDNTVNLTVSASGGSGSYNLAIYTYDSKGNPERIIYETQVTGTSTHTITVDASDLRKRTAFAVRLSDKDNDDSYMIIQGVKFKAFSERTDIAESS